MSAPLYPTLLPGLRRLLTGATLLALLALGAGCPTTVDDDDSAANDDDATGDDDDATGDDDDATGDDDDATGDDDDATGDDDDATGDDDDSAGDDDDSAGDDDDSASVDGDSDGFDASEDCDDGDAAIYPGAPETCDDAIDDDCDPSTDCQGACAPTVTYAGPCGTTPTFAGPSPMLLWDFDTPGSLFTDQSGNSNNGSNEGTWSSVASGWLGQSADLDEAYAYATVGSPAAWTSAQWVNLDALPGLDFSMLSGNGNGTTDWTGWAVVINTQGQAGAYVEGGSSGVETVLISTDTACIGGWAHVAATWDSGTLSVYVDGTLAASVVAPFSAIVPGELPFTIGWDGNQQRRYVDGQLDDVALWGSALSASDIAAVAADGFCGVPL